MNKTPRLKGNVISKPIIYGNTAALLGKRVEGDATHKWSLFVRSAENEDMSNYVKKVTFRLHESFDEPVRECDKYPYEVTENGWGEFEVVITIHFLDPGEKPITLYHVLALFENDDTVPLTKRSLVSEKYDELVFNEPSEAFSRLLLSSAPVLTSRPHRGGDVHYTPARNYPEIEKQQLEMLEDARVIVKKEVTKLRQRYRKADSTAKRLHMDIAALEAQLKQYSA